MAEELFGTPIGVSRAEQDMARQAMTAAHVGQIDTQMQLAPMVAAQKFAQARYLSAKAGVAEGDANIQSKVAALAAGHEWTDDEKKNPAWTLANMYQEAGSPKDAIKTAGVAASIDQKEASATTNKARQDLIGVRSQMANIDLLSRDMRGVDSPEALQAALSRHEQTAQEQTGLLDEQGQLRPEAAANWEDTRDRIQSMALGEKDRMLADYRTKALANLSQEFKSRQDNRSFWQSTENQEARERAKTKGRGTKVGLTAVDKIDPKFGTDFVNSQFVHIETNQGKVLGRQLAEQAVQARTLNPALTPSEAAKAAFESMDKQNLFGGLTKRPPGANESEKRPLALPEDGDKSKLKPGFWYSDGNTKMQWGGPGVGWKKQTTGKGSGTIRPVSAAYVPPENDTEDAQSAIEDAQDENMAMEE